MSDPAALQTIDGPTSPSRSREAGLAAKRGDGPEPFEKVLNEVAAHQEAGVQPEGDASLSPTTEDRPPLLSSGSQPLGDHRAERIEHEDKKNKAEPAVMPVDPALNPIVGLMPLPIESVQAVPEGDSSLPLASPKGERPGITPLSQADPSAPEKGGLNPIGMKDPQDILSNPVLSTDQKAGGMQISSEPSAQPDGPSPADQGLHSIREETSQPKTEGRPDPPSSTRVEPNGPESNGISLLKAASAEGREKEKTLFSDFSHTDPKGSERTGAGRGSERTDPIGGFAQEMMGTGSTPVSSTGLQGGDPFEKGVRAAEFVQAKTTAGASVLDGMPEGRPLLHQIAEKWSLSLSKDEHSFRLQLEPASLGALQIDISVRQERVVAEIVTKHPFVKELLEGNQELLKGALAEQGITVDRFSVNIGNPGQASYGWENRLRQGRADSPYDTSDRSFLSPAEIGDVSTQRRSIHEGAWSAINIYA